nr:calmodulin-binding transcription activator 5 isoform X1 [Ipomoea batatas]
MLEKLQSRKSKLDKKLKRFLVAAAIAAPPVAGALARSTAISHWRNGEIAFIEPNQTLASTIVCSAVPPASPDAVAAAWSWLEMDYGVPGLLSGSDIHGFHTLEDCNGRSQNEMAAILCNYKYFTVHVRPVNLPRGSFVMKKEFMYTMHIEKITQHLFADVTGCQTSMTVQGSPATPSSALSDLSPPWGLTEGYELPIGCANYNRPLASLVPYSVREDELMYA